MNGAGLNGGESLGPAVRRSRVSPEEVRARQVEAVERCKRSASIRNELAVVAGFLERGIPEAEILPRINVFTYGAWQAQGRQVKRGEKSLRLSVWVPIPGDPGQEPKLIARTAHVFHVSQTEARS